MCKTRNRPAERGQTVEGPTREKAWVIRMLRIWAPPLVVALAGAACLGAEPGRSPRDGWNFNVKEFIIAAWCPPAPTDAEYRFYKQAGFNLVMGPRYPLPDKALELARKHGLMVMIDTYTPNDRPWGGKAGKYTPHPTHHPATLPELKWLHARYGKHPALAGYLLGDDYGSLPPELIETTNWLRKNAPHLFPWICQNRFSPDSLAKHGNPFANPQIYPTLYQRNQPAAKQAELFCGALEALRASCRRYDLISWPMFNVSGIGTDSKVESDSLVRFQVYASLAYGAQGIWYFTYRGYGSLVGGKEGGRAFETDEEVKAQLDPKWTVARDANHRVAAWGPMLLGRKADRVYHTGVWPVRSQPQARPGSGKVIARMSDGLLVGILRKAGEAPLAMVVDKRVDKRPQARSPRAVEVRFSDAVTSIVVFEKGGGRIIQGPAVKLSLSSGGGQLLKLLGKGV